MSKYKKWRHTIQYVKRTAQLVFKIDFQKVDQHAGGSRNIIADMQSISKFFKIFLTPIRTSHLSEIQCRLLEGQYHNSYISGNHFTNKKH